MEKDLNSYCRLIKEWESTMRKNNVDIPFQLRELISLRWRRYIPDSCLLTRTVISTNYVPFRGNNYVTASSLIAAYVAPIVAKK
jgi:hypothetical protein